MWPRCYLAANVWALVWIQAVWFSGPMLLTGTQQFFLWDRLVRSRSFRHSKGALTCMCVLFSAWLGHPLFFLTLYKHTGFNDIISFNQLNVFKHPLILFWHSYFSIYRYFIWCYDSLTQNYCAVPSDKFCEGFNSVNFKDLDTHCHHLPKRMLGETHSLATLTEESVHLKQN